MTKKAIDASTQAKYTEEEINNHIYAILYGEDYESFFTDQKEFAALFSDDPSSLRKIPFSHEYTTIHSQKRDLKRHCIRFDVNYWPHNNGLEVLIDEFLPLVPMPKKQPVQWKVKSALTVVLANLYEHEQRLPGFYTVMSRDNNFYLPNSRYNPLNVGRSHLTRVVDALHDNGLIEFHNGFYIRKKKDGYRSRIRPSESLLKRFKLLSDVSIGWHADREVIILKTKDKDGKKHLKPYGKDEEGNDDSTRVKGMRKRCNAYNKLLAETDLSFPLSDDVLRLRNEGRAEVGRYLLNPFAKHLYRVFNEGFAGAGRFYGGWWELIPSEERSQIKINGNHVVELDFSAYHPTLLYLKYVNKLPEGDVYDLPVLREAMPEVDRAELRSVVKKAFLVLLNAPTRSSAKKSLLQTGRRELKYALLQEMDLDVLFDAIEARHPEIWQYFGAGMALTLQNWDSKVADSIMEIMMCEKGIPCLPVHDSFIVAAQHAHTLRAAMEKAMELNGWSHCPRIDQK